MKIKVDIAEESIDKIVVDQLEDYLKYLVEASDEDWSGIPFKHQDRDKDLKHIKKKIKAYKHVISDWG